MTTLPPATMTPRAPADDAHLLEACDDAVFRATRWLVQQLRPDGALGDPADGFTYHRAPWAFTLAGRHDEAYAVCGWVRRTLLTPGGDLSGPERRSTDGWAYRDSSLIIGAHMLQQYDLSIGLMPSLLRWQDPVSGGFANDLTDDGPSDEMDIPYACGPGLACLITGELASAHRVADFLRTVHDAQDQLPDRMFCFWSRDRQAPIRYADPGFQERFVVENAVDRMQRWTAGGIAAAFLGRLHQAHPDPALVSLARAYQSFSMAATNAQLRYPSACKSSWGAAVLYEVTGDEVYLDWLGRFARWYLAAQEPEGYWHPWVERTRGQVIEITLEFVMHLVTLTGAVRGRLSGSLT
ncbi:MAG: hypothetical protein M3171_01455 [Actinomycetota bacterium]|nr:hypothetical protein [Actinomycetota bacterium]